MSLAFYYFQRFDSDIWEFVIHSLKEEGREKGTKRRSGKDRTGGREEWKEWKKKIKEADGKGEGRKKEEARESQGMERGGKKENHFLKMLFLETRLFYGKKKRGVKKNFPLFFVYVPVYKALFYTQLPTVL